MRVDTLYVIGYHYGEDQEVMRVCDGLVAKHSTRANNLAYLYAIVPSRLDGRLRVLTDTPSRIELIKNFGDPPLGNTIDTSKALTVHADATEDKLAGKGRKIGIYLVAHGRAGMSGDKARLPVNILDEVIPADQRQHVEKVVALLCNVANATPEQKAVDERTQGSAEVAESEPKDVSFMFGFVKFLAAKGMSPMVVGFDSYISALPAAPKSKVFDGQTIDTGHAMELQAVVPGRKFGQYCGNRKGTLSADFRRQHKKYFRIEDGKVKFATHPDNPGILWSDQWTDK